MWVVGGAGMKEIVKRIMDGDPQLPVNVTYPPAQIATAIELTALGLVSADAGLRPVHHRLAGHHARERRRVLLPGQPLLIRPD